MAHSILPNVKQYTKNVIKSTAYASADIIGDMMPGVSDFADTNKEVFKNVYVAIKDYKKTFSRIQQAIVKSKVYEAADVGLKNLKSDLSTGMWYNKNRQAGFEEEALQKSMEDNSEFKLDDSELGDIGGGSLEDLDKMMGFDDSEFNEEDLNINDGDALIADTVSKSAAKSTSTLANLQVKSVDTLMKTSRINTSILYAQNEKMMKINEEGFSTLNQTSSNILKFATEGLQKHMENAASFYTESQKLDTERNAILKEMLEMQRNMYKMYQLEEKPQDDKNKKLGWGDIATSAGLPDLEKYLANIQQNFGKILDDSGFGMIKAMGGMMGDNPLLAFAQNPLGDMVKMMVSTALGVRLQEAAKSFDETLSGVFGNFVGKMNYLASEGGGPLGFLGQLLGVRDTVKTTLDTNTYKRGAMPWDGEAKKALTEVIPHYLANIEAALTGRHQLFDYQSGKYVTSEQLQSQMQSMQERYTMKPFGDIDEMLAPFFRNIQNADRKTQRDFLNDYVRMKEYWAGGKGRFQRSFKINTGTTTDTAGEEIYDEVLEDLAMEMGLTDANNLKTIIGQLKKASGPSDQPGKRVGRRGALLGVEGKIMEARASQTREMQNLQDQNSILTQLFNGGYMHTLNRKTGIVGNKDTLMDRMHMKNQLDDRGNNIFYYLQNILSSLISIQVEGFNIGSYDELKRLHLKGKSKRKLSRGQKTDNLTTSKQSITDQLARYRGYLNDDSEKVKTEAQRYRDRENKEDEYYANRVKENRKRQLEKGKKYKGPNIIGFADGSEIDIADEATRIRQLAEATEKVLNTITQENEKKTEASKTWLGKQWQKIKDDSKVDNADQIKSMKDKGFLQALVDAGSIGEKWGVIKVGLQELADKPSTFLTGILEKADERLYKFFFEEEEVIDKRTGKKYSGFLGRLRAELDNLFVDMNEGLNKYLFEPLKEKLGVEGPWDAIKQGLGYVGIDVDAITGNIKETFKETGGQIWDSVKETFTDAFQDAADALAEEERKLREATGMSTEDNLVRSITRTGTESSTEEDKVKQSRENRKRVFADPKSSLEDKARALGISEKAIKELIDSGNRDFLERKVTSLAMHDRGYVRSQNLQERQNENKLISAIQGTSNAIDTDELRGHIATIESLGDESDKNKMYEIIGKRTKSSKKDIDTKRSKLSFLEEELARTEEDKKNITDWDQLGEMLDLIDSMKTQISSIKTELSSMIDEDLLQDINDKINKTKVSKGGGKHLKDFAKKNFDRGNFNFQDIISDQSVVKEMQDFMNENRDLAFDVYKEYIENFLQNNLNIHDSFAREKMLDKLRYRYRKQKSGDISKVLDFKYLAGEIKKYIETRKQDQDSIKMKDALIESDADLRLENREGNILDTKSYDKSSVIEIPEDEDGLDSLVRSQEQSTEKVGGFFGELKDSLVSKLDEVVNAIKNISLPSAEYDTSQIDLFAGRAEGRLAPPETAIISKGEIVKPLFGQGRKITKTGLYQLGRGDSVIPNASASVRSKNAKEETAKLSQISSDVSKGKDITQHLAHFVPSYATGKTGIMTFDSKKEEDKYINSIAGRIIQDIPKFAEGKVTDEEIIQFVQKYQTDLIARNLNNPDMIIELADLMKRDDPKNSTAHMYDMYAWLDNKYAKIQKDIGKEGKIKVGNKELGSDAVSDLRKGLRQSRVQARMETLEAPKLLLDGVNNMKEGAIDFFSSITGLNSKEVKKATSEAYAEVKQGIPNVVAKSALGTVGGLLLGGPLVGAMLGAGVGIVQSSETFKSAIFGEVLERDADGNVISRKDNGLIGQEIQDTFNKYAPSMKGLGIAGGILGLITPFGPLGGAMIGAGIGALRANEDFKEAFFGKQGLIDEDLQKFFKKAAPNAAAAAAGMAFLGPFGLVGNLALGAGVGLLGSTEDFKTYLFGREVDGKRQGGLVGALKEGVIDPWLEFGKRTKDELFDWVKKDVFGPLKGAMFPIAKQIQLGVTGLFQGVGNFINHWAETILGRPIATLFRDKILKPLSDFGTKVLGGILKPIKSVVSAPFKLIGGVGDILKRRQIQMGNADYMSASERLKFREEKGMNMDDQFTAFDRKIATASSDNLKTILETSKLMQSGDKELKKKQDEGIKDLWAYIDALMKKNGKEDIDIDVKTKIDELLKANNPEDTKKAIELINQATGNMGETQSRDILRKLEEVQSKALSRKEAYENFQREGKGAVARYFKEHLGIDVDSKNIDKISDMLEKEYVTRKKSDRREEDKRKQGGEIAFEDAITDQTSVLAGYLQETNKILRAMATSGGLLTLEQTNKIQTHRDIFQESIDDKTRANAQKAGELNLGLAHFYGDEQTKKLDKDSFEKLTRTAGKNEVNLSGELLELGQKGFVTENLKGLIAQDEPVLKRVFTLFRETGLSTDDFENLAKLDNDQFNNILNAAATGLNVTNLEDFKDVTIREAADMKWFRDNTGISEDYLSNRALLTMIRKGYASVIRSPEGIVLDDYFDPSKIDTEKMAKLHREKATVKKTGNMNRRAPKIPGGKTIGNSILNFASTTGEIPINLVAAYMNNFGHKPRTKYLNGRNNGSLLRTFGAAQSVGDFEKAGSVAYTKGIFDDKYEEATSRETQSSKDAALKLLQLGLSKEQVEEYTGTKIKDAEDGKYDITAESHVKRDSYEDIMNDKIGTAAGDAQKAVNRLVMSSANVQKDVLGDIMANTDLGVEDSAKVFGTYKRAFGRIGRYAEGGDGILSSISNKFGNLRDNTIARAKNAIYTSDKSQLVEDIVGNPYKDNGLDMLQSAVISGAGLGGTAIEKGVNFVTSDIPSKILEVVSMLDPNIVQQATDFINQGFGLFADGRIGLYSGGRRQRMRARAAKLSGYKVPPPIKNIKTKTIEEQTKEVSQEVSTTPKFEGIESSNALKNLVALQVQSYEKLGFLVNRDVIDKLDYSKGIKGLIDSGYNMKSVFGVGKDKDTMTFTGADGEKIELDAKWYNNQPEEKQKEIAMDVIQQVEKGGDDVKKGIITIPTPYGSKRVKVSTDGTEITADKDSKDIEEKVESDHEARVETVSTLGEIKELIADFFGGKKKVKEEKKKSFWEIFKDLLKMIAAFLIGGGLLALLNGAADNLSGLIGKAFRGALEVTEKAIVNAIKEATKPISDLVNKFKAIKLEITRPKVPEAHINARNAVSKAEAERLAAGAGAGRAIQGSVAEGTFKYHRAVSDADRARFAQLEGRTSDFLTEDEKAFMKNHRAAVAAENDANKLLNKIYNKGYDSLTEVERRAIPNIIGNNPELGELFEKAKTVGGSRASFAEGLASNTSLRDQIIQRGRDIGSGFRDILADNNEVQEAIRREGGYKAMVTENAIDAARGLLRGGEAAYDRIGQGFGLVRSGVSNAAGLVRTGAGNIADFTRNAGNNIIDRTGLRSAKDFLFGSAPSAEELASRESLAMYMAEHGATTAEIQQAIAEMEGQGSKGILDRIRDKLPSFGSKGTAEVVGEDLALWNEGANAARQAGGFGSETFGKIYGTMNEMGMKGLGMVGAGIGAGAGLLGSIGSGISSAAGAVDNRLAENFGLKYKVASFAPKMLLGMPGFAVDSIKETANIGKSLIKGNITSELSTMAAESSMLGAREALAADASRTQKVVRGVVEGAEKITGPVSQAVFRAVGIISSGLSRFLSFIPGVDGSRLAQGLETLANTFTKEAVGQMTKRGATQLALRLIGKVFMVTFAVEIANTLYEGFANPGAILGIADQDKISNPSRVLAAICNALSHVFLGILSPKTIVNLVIEYIGPIIGYGEEEKKLQEESKAEFEQYKEEHKAEILAKFGDKEFTFEDYMKETGKWNNKGMLENIGSFIVEGFKAVIGEIPKFIFDKLNDAAKTMFSIGDQIRSAKDYWNKLSDRSSEIMRSLGKVDPERLEQLNKEVEIADDDPIKGIKATMKEFATSHWFIMGTVGWILGKAGDLFGGVFDGIGGAFTGVKDSLKGMYEAVVEGSPTKIIDGILAASESDTNATGIGRTIGAIAPLIITPLSVPALVLSTTVGGIKIVSDFVGEVTDTFNALPESQKLIDGLLIMAEDGKITELWNTPNPFNNPDDKGGHGIGYVVAGLTYSVAKVAMYPVAAFNWIGAKLRHGVEDAVGWISGNDKFNLDFYADYRGNPLADEYWNHSEFEFDPKHPMSALPSIVETIYKWGMMPLKAIGWAIHGVADVVSKPSSFLTDIKNKVLSIIGITEDIEKQNKTMSEGKKNEQAVVPEKKPESVPTNVVDASTLTQLPVESEGREGIQKYAKGRFNEIKKYAEGRSGGIQGTIVTAIGDFVSSIGGGILNYVGGIASGITDTIKGMYDAVYEGEPKKILSGFSGIFGNDSKASGLGQAVGSMVSLVLTPVSIPALGLSVITGAIKLLRENAVQPIIDTLSDVKDGGLDTFKSIREAIIEGRPSKIIDNVLNKISSGDTSKANIIGSMLPLLHIPMIVPAFGLSILTSGVRKAMDLLSIEGLQEGMNSLSTGISNTVSGMFDAVYEGDPSKIIASAQEAYSQTDSSNGVLKAIGAITPLVITPITGLTFSLSLVTHAFKVGKESVTEAVDSFKSVSDSQKLIEGLLPLAREGKIRELWNTENPFFSGNNDMSIGSAIAGTVYGIAKVGMYPIAAYNWVGSSIRNGVEKIISKVSGVDFKFDFYEKYDGNPLDSKYLSHNEYRFDPKYPITALPSLAETMYKYGMLPFKIINYILSSLANVLNAPGSFLKKIKDKALGLLNIANDTTNNGNSSGGKTVQSSSNNVSTAGSKKPTQVTPNTNTTSTVIPSNTAFSNNTRKAIDAIDKLQKDKGSSGEKIINSVVDDNFKKIDNDIKSKLGKEAIDYKSASDADKDKKFDEMLTKLKGNKDFKEASEKLKNELKAIGYSDVTSEMAQLILARKLIDKNAFGKGSISSRINRLGLGFNRYQQNAPGNEKIKFNRPGDTKVDTVAARACGPFAMGAALENVTGKPTDMGKELELGQKHLEKDDGTRFEYFKESGRRAGLNVTQTSNIDKINEAAREPGTSVVRMVDTGKGMHYETTTGQIKGRDGKLYNKTTDPEKSRTILTDASKDNKQTQTAFIMKRAKGRKGFGRGLVDDFLDNVQFNAKTIDENATEDTSEKTLASLNIRFGEGTIPDWNTESKNYDTVMKGLDNISSDSIDNSSFGMGRYGKADDQLDEEYGGDRNGTRKSSKLLDPDAPPNLPRFSQNDTRWYQKPFPGGSNNSIALSGCGPTSLAMIGTWAEGKLHYPDEVANWVGERGGHVSGGISYGAFNQWAEAHGGWKFRQTDSIDEAINEGLKKKKPVLNSQGPGLFTKSGHMIVLAGIRNDGSIIVYDPNRRKPEDGYSKDDVHKSVGGGYWIPEGDNIGQGNAIAGDPVRGGGHSVGGTSTGGTTTSGGSTGGNASSGRSPNLLQRIFDLFYGGGGNVSYSTTQSSSTDNKNTTKGSSTAVANPNSDIPYVKGNGYDCAPGKAEPMQPVWRISIHHSGSGVAGTDLSAADAHRMHTTPDPKDPSKPWAAIGYHFVIRKNGDVERGRLEKWQGAHTKDGKPGETNGNIGSIGIHVSGDFNCEEPTKQQLDSLAQLVCDLCHKYGIKFDRDVIRGHYEWSGGIGSSWDGCPGKNLGKHLDAIVKKASTLQTKLKGGSKDTNTDDSSKKSELGKGTKLKVNPIKMEVTGGETRNKFGKGIIDNYVDRGINSIMDNSIEQLRKEYKDNIVPIQHPDISNAVGEDSGSTDANIGFVGPKNLMINANDSDVVRDIKENKQNQWMEKAIDKKEANITMENTGGETRNNFGRGRYGKAKIDYSSPLLAGGDDQQEDRYKYSWAWLTDPNKGKMSEEQAAGVIGNMMDELPSLQPHVYMSKSTGVKEIMSAEEAPDLGDEEQGYGIFMYTNIGSTKNIKALAEWGKATGKKTGTLDGQFEYGFTKFNPDAVDETRKTKTIDDATYVFMKKFERPAGDGHIDKRKANAKMIYDKYKGQKFEDIKDPTDSGKVSSDASKNKTTDTTKDTNKSSSSSSSGGNSIMGLIDKYLIGGFTPAAESLAKQVNDQYGSNLTGSDVIPGTSSSKDKLGKGTIGFDNIEGYQGLDDNKITGDEPISVQRAKRQAQLEWMNNRPVEDKARTATTETISGLLNDIPDSGRAKAMKMFNTNNDTKKLQEDKTYLFKQSKGIATEVTSEDMGDLKGKNKAVVERMNRTGKALSHIRSLFANSAGPKTPFTSGIFGRGRSTGSDADNKAIYEYMKAKGLSDVAATGIMGNLKAESYLASNQEQNRPQGEGPEDVIIDGMTGYGLAQWTTQSRQQKLADYQKSHGKKGDDWQGQLDFMISGSDEPIDATIKAMDESKDPHKAALIFHTKYERSADSDEQASRRGEYAKQFFDSYSGNANGTSNINMAGAVSASSDTSTPADNNSNSSGVSGLIDVGITGGLINAIKQSGYIELIKDQYGIDITAEQLAGQGANSVSAPTNNPATTGETTDNSSGNNTSGENKKLTVGETETPDQPVSGSAAEYQAQVLGMSLDEAVSSPYGYRNHPISGGRKFHQGIDFLYGGGMKIKSSTDGEVVIAGDLGDGYGTTVRIKDTEGFYHLYAHGSQALVNKGDKVKKGDDILVADTTGSSTGDHLHYGIHTDDSGSRQSSVNPYAFKLGKGTNMMDSLLNMEDEMNNAVDVKDINKVAKDSMKLGMGTLIYHNIPEYRGISDNIINDNDSIAVQRAKYEAQQEWVNNNAVKEDEVDNLGNYKAYFSHPSMIEDNVIVEDDSIQLRRWKRDAQKEQLFGYGTDSTEKEYNDFEALSLRVDNIESRLDTLERKMAINRRNLSKDISNAEKRTKTLEDTENRTPIRKPISPITNRPKTSKAIITREESIEYNGKKYRKIDIEDLMEKKEISQEEAIKELEKDKRWIVKEGEYGDGTEYTPEYKKKKSSKVKKKSDIQSSTKDKDKGEELVEYNGKKYRKNDVDYLVKNGKFTEKAALSLLEAQNKWVDENGKYGDGSKYTPIEKEKNKDKGEELIEYNGKRYRKNDVDYIMINQKIDQKAALAYLEAQKKWIEEDGKYADGSTYTSKEKKEDTEEEETDKELEALKKKVKAPANGRMYKRIRDDKGNVRYEQVTSAEDVSDGDEIVVEDSKGRVVNNTILNGVGTGSSKKDIETPEEESTESDSEVGKLRKRIDVIRKGGKFKKVINRDGSISYIPIIDDSEINEGDEIVDKNGKPVTDNSSDISKRKPSVLESLLGGIITGVTNSENGKPNWKGALVGLGMGLLGNIFNKKKDKKKDENLKNTPDKSKAPVKEDKKVEEELIEYNGKKYRKNDVDYLMKNGKFSEDGALSLLESQKKWVEEEGKYGDGTTYETNKVSKDKKDSSSDKKKGKPLSIEGPIKPEDTIVGGGFTGGYKKNKQPIDLGGIFTGTNNTESPLGSLGGLLGGSNIDGNIKLEDTIVGGGFTGGYKKNKQGIDLGGLLGSNNDNPLGSLGGIFGNSNIGDNPLGSLGGILGGIFGGNGTGSGYIPGIGETSGQQSGSKPNWKGALIGAGIGILGSIFGKKKDKVDKVENKPDTKKAPVAPGVKKLDGFKPNRLYKNDKYNELVLREQFNPWYYSDKDIPKGMLEENLISYDDDFVVFEAKLLKQKEWLKENGLLDKYPYGTSEGVAETRTENDVIKYSGKKYKKNDIVYLMKEGRYTEKDALDLLKKEKKWIAESETTSNNESDEEKSTIDSKEETSDKKESNKKVKAPKAPDVVEEEKKKDEERKVVKPPTAPKVSEDTEAIDDSSQEEETSKEVEAKKKEAIVKGKVDHYEGKVKIGEASNDSEFNNTLLALLQNIAENTAKLVEFASKGNSNTNNNNLTVNNSTANFHSSPGTTKDENGFANLQAMGSRLYEIAKK